MPSLQTTQRARTLRPHEGLGKNIPCKSDSLLLYFWNPSEDRYMYYFYILISGTKILGSIPFFL